MSTSSQKKQSKKKSKLSSIISFVIFIALFSTLFILNNSNGDQEQGPYPPYYKPSNTKTLSLNDYKGKIVILDFWATWCPPCRKGIPDLIDLKKAYKDKGVEVIGISVDDNRTKADVTPFIKKYGINYPVVFGNSRTSQNYGGIRSIPTSFVIDKQGNILSRYVGLVSKQTFVNDINKILSKSYKNKKNLKAKNFTLTVAN